MADALQLSLCCMCEFAAQQHVLRSLYEQMAISHMAERGSTVDPADETAAQQLRQIEFAVKAIEATKKTLSNTSSY